MDCISACQSELSPLRFRRTPLSNPAASPSWSGPDLRNSTKRPDDNISRAVKKPYGKMSFGVTMRNRTKIPDGTIGSELIREDVAFTDMVTQFVAGLGDRVVRME